jgi:uncharacterized membrane protein
MRRWLAQLWPARPWPAWLPRAKLLAKQALALLLRLRVPIPGWLRGLGWRRLAGVVLLAGIVHICATLAVPTLSTRHAYLRLRDRLPANRMVVLPQQAPGRQILPWLPPHTLYAVCRYDLSGGPVAVNATVADAGWALTLHAVQGENFYVLPGQPLRRTEVSLLVVPRTPDSVSPSWRESPSDTSVISPTTEGLIVLRAPLRGLAWTAETEAMLQRATCTPLKSE